MTAQLFTTITLMVMAMIGNQLPEVGATHSGKVLLVSMDGFRWDYIHKVSGLRYFPQLAKEGCSVQYVNNTFATITFPCHYSIITGLYEETHGIVANRMYDRKRKTIFTMGSKESYWWEGGEPIWITMEKHKRGSSAVYFWPGSESVIQGLRPSLFMPYHQPTPFEERIRTAVGWFRDLNKDFVALYFHEPDSTGHAFGPDSPQVAAKVREMDGVLGQILAELDLKNLSDTVNLIVTSDHGMTDVSVPDKLINLWDHVDRSLVEIVPDAGAVTHVLPKEGQEAEVLRQANLIPHAIVYRKENIPDHFHYKNNDRIMPIVIVADEGWTVSSNVNDTLDWGPKGNHGYSNDLPSMKPIFFARGPDFRQDVKIQSIRSVDIYPLMCRLLNVRPAPNNGSLANTDPFVVRDNSAGSNGSSGLRVPLSALLGVTLLFLLMVLR